MKWASLHTFECCALEILNDFVHVYSSFRDLVYVDCRMLLTAGGGVHMRN